MTAKQIATRMNAEQKRVAIKHETAIRIRELLDKARIAYGPEDWDDEDS